MDLIIEIVIVSLIAGVGGTGLGGLIGILFRHSSNHVISLLLSVTSGIMVAIVCFELIPESVQASYDSFGDYGVFLSGISILAGVVVVLILNWMIDRSTGPQVAHTAAPEHPDTHDNLDELVHIDHYNEHYKQGDSKRDLWMAGVVIACAIALHNIPEGMSIGASYSIQTEGAIVTALMLAVLIGLHNIPEGMAVAVPLIAGGMGRAKAVLLTAASGIPMVIGALLGLWLGDIGEIGLCFSLGFASGAMLYVVFGEIVPQATLMYKSRKPAIVLIIGILIGMCLIYL